MMNQQPEPIEVLLQFIDSADVNRSQPLLANDGWQIVSVSHNPPEIRVLLPEYVAQPLRVGDRNWDEFSNAAFQMFGAVNYSVCVHALPSKNWIAIS